MPLEAEGDSMGAALRDKAHRSGEASILFLSLPYSYFGIKDSHTVGANEVEVRLLCSFSEQSFKPLSLLGIGFGEARGKEVSGSHSLTNTIIQYLGSHFGARLQPPSL